MNLKKILKVATGAASVALGGAALFLSKKSGEIQDEETDMTKLEPLGGEAEPVEAEELKEEKEEEESEDNNEE